MKCDINMIRKAAHKLADEPVLRTDIKLIVKHPFTNLSIVKIDSLDNVIDITSSKEDESIWRDYIHKKIDECDLMRLLMFMNKSYRLYFICIIREYLDEVSFCKLLSDNWKACEFPFNIKDLMYDAFTSVNNRLLMSESELKVYDGLDEKVVIFRGVSNKDEEYARGLSWTINPQVAKWFSERFTGNNKEAGTVYSTTVNKEAIIAYFDYENEVIVDYEKIEDIEIVEL